MRFLLDRCVPRHVTELLRDAGHDAVETRDRGPDPGDAVIMQWAVSEDRVLVTADGDFAMLALRFGATHRGIVQLPHDSVEELRAIVGRVLAAHPGDELTSAVVIATASRIRSFRVIGGGRGQP